MANFIGAILGAMLAIYLISKLIEWVLVKRIVQSRSAMILISTSAALLLVFILWYSALGKPYAQGVNFLLAYLLGSLFLAALRCSRSKSTKGAQSTD